MAMPKAVARDRLRRKLAAARIRSNYKYKDPNNIPVEAGTVDEVYSSTRRPTPFADRLASRR